MLFYEQEVAKQLATQAGEILMRLFGQGIGVDRKAGDEPVTEADRAANAAIVEGLKKAFPDDAILSEEQPDDGSRHHKSRVWMVDPMDGTKDFIRNETGFSVMIGLVESGQPKLGVVYHPSVRRMIVGITGEGASVEHDGLRRRLTVSTVADLTQARLVSSKQNRGALTEKIRETLQVSGDQPYGSVGLKIALVASGEHDLYVNPSERSKLWDLAAPEAILKAAGGQVTDLHGRAVDYTRHELANLDGILATNGLLHALALQRLRLLFP